MPSDAVRRSDRRPAGPSDVFDAPTLPGFALGLLAGSIMVPWLNNSSRGSILQALACSGGVKRKERQFLMSSQ